MKTPFDSDALLVPDPVDIADSLIPPPEYGQFAIRWPYQCLTAHGQLRNIRILLWSCMDQRVVWPLYSHVLAQGFAPANILVIAIAGGPLQMGTERLAIVKEMLKELEGRLSNLEKVWAVAHTKVCRGLAYFCGGRSLAESLKPEWKAQASARSLDAELYATQLALPSAYDLLPERWHSITELAVCEPLEQTKSVRLYSQWFTRDDSKAIAELLS